MLKPWPAAFSLVAFLALGALDVAHAAGTEVGKLDCDVSSGIGAIIGSQQEVQCSFIPSAPGQQTNYFGKITSFGLEIGEIKKSRLIWLVYAPSRDGVGTLEGRYRGAEANVSVGVGLGANILIGGGKNSFALQPVSVEAEQGINIAVGVAEMTLRVGP